MALKLGDFNPRHIMRGGKGGREEKASHDVLQIIDLNCLSIPDLSYISIMPAACDIMNVMFMAPVLCSFTHYRRLA
jgi:hypothetical protein